MCVVSMVVDHYTEKWDRRVPYSGTSIGSDYMVYPGGVNYPNTTVEEKAVTTRRIPTPAEVEEFYELLGKAREYDKAHNQPSCEMEEKKAALMKVAAGLGIRIEFSTDDGLLKGD